MTKKEINIMNSIKTIEEYLQEIQPKNKHEYQNLVGVQSIIEDLGKSLHKDYEIEEWKNLEGGTIQYQCKGCEVCNDK